MIYVGPAPENTCAPGQGETFTEELGRHCVDFVVQHVDKLPATGGDGDILAVLAVVAAHLVILSLGLLAVAWWRGRKRE